MSIEAIKAEATRLLNDYYQIYTDDLPAPRMKSAWEKENKRGFFLGLINEGQEMHIGELYNLLNNNQFKDQQNLSTSVQLANAQHSRSFIDDMFDYYITPFHRNYNSSSNCNTSHNGSSNASSKGNSLEDLDDASEPKHVELKAAVEKRDVVCLFCWNRVDCQGAHIIAQKTTRFADDLFHRSRLEHKHQVENGLLLCIGCHSQFDKLKRYVDVMDEKLVIKLVNETNDLRSDKHKDWEEKVVRLKRDREASQQRWADVDNRQALEPNGEMALYFVINHGLPNREALAFHKAACLIWRIAGGAESEEEYCPDDDDDVRVPVDYRTNNIEAWMDSSATIIIGNDSSDL